MKVIVIENPKFIGPVLRKFYGIKKEKPQQT
ncbi:MAG: stage V sporulation protein SpoVM [Oscillospiraceae bacterium]|nr:stage V sporulation protein SpoVM [Oscillospiraceae bacterium]